MNSDNQTCNSDRQKVVIAYGFSGENLMPKEITKLLGVIPTSTTLKGEIRPGKRHPAPWGGWDYEIEGDEDVEDLANKLLDIFREKIDIIDTIRNNMGYFCRIHIWLDSSSGYGGSFYIKSAILLELARLTDRFDIVIM